MSAQSFHISRVLCFDNKDDDHENLDGGDDSVTMAMTIMTKMAMTIMIKMAMITMSMTTSLAEALRPVGPGVLLPSLGSLTFFHNTFVSLNAK